MQLINAVSKHDPKLNLSGIINTAKFFCVKKAKQNKKKHRYTYFCGYTHIRVHTYET